MQFWEQYWADKNNPQHRYESEEFYCKLANEHLYHMGGGRRLLDFGCGSASLLVYYSRSYQYLVGADFSENMIKAARDRVELKKIKNIELVHADDKQIWNHLKEKFDGISCSGVIQYLDLPQIEYLIQQGKQWINEGGKICFFDVIDPRIYHLWMSGVLKGQKSNIFNMIFKLSKLMARNKLRKWKGLPVDHTGVGYHPNTLKSIAGAHGLEMEYVCSMYYEYRYHCIFTPRSDTIN